MQGDRNGTAFWRIVRNLLTAPSKEQEVGGAGRRLWVGGIGLAVIKVQTLQHNQMAHKLNTCMHAQPPKKPGVSLTKAYPIGRG
jgi:hypothetical protein